MKAYFEPKMNISVFEKADVVTTSGTLAGLFSSDAQQSGNNFYKMSFNDIYNSPDSVSTNTTIN